MFNFGGASIRGQAVFVTLGLLALSTLSHAATVGQWEGNKASTIWAGTGNFSSFYGAATAAGLGHTIETPEAITASTLANNTHFIISAPAALPGAESLAALRNWVMAGGVLLLMADPNNNFGGNTAAQTVNQILSQIGSNMSAAVGYAVGGSTFASYGPLQGAGVPVVGSSGDLNGGYLSTMAFLPLAYGTGFGAAGTGINNLIRVGNLNEGGTQSIGQIYLFGNAQLNSNGALLTNANNRTFFLNLLGQDLSGGGSSGGGGFDGVSGESPEPGTISLIGFGLAAAVWLRRRKVA